MLKRQKGQHWVWEAMAGDAVGKRTGARSDGALWNLRDDFIPSSAQGQYSLFGACSSEDSKRTTLQVGRDPSHRDAAALPGVTCPSSWL